MTDAAAPAEWTLPLFYKTPIPLDTNIHRDWGLREARTLSYAGKANAIPLLAEEFISLNGVYPIVFSPGANPVAVALVGLRQEENLFVDAEGKWRANCPVPAYVRRYPFLVMETPERDRMLLCVDSDQDIVGPDGEVKLFENGQATQGAKDILDFCMAFNRSAQATQAFCKELADRDLLVDQRLDVTLPNGIGPVAINGFRVVDEQKLAALPDDVFLELRKRNWISLIYAHLASLGRWRLLAELLSDRLTATPAA